MELLTAVGLRNQSHRLFVGALVQLTSQMHFICRLKNRTRTNFSFVFLLKNCVNTEWRVAQQTCFDLTWMAAIRYWQNRPLGSPGPWERVLSARLQPKASFFFHWLARRATWDLMYDMVFPFVDWCETGRMSRSRVIGKYLVCVYCLVPWYRATIYQIRWRKMKWSSHRSET